MPTNVQGPVIDPRPAELRSIANSIEPAFPDQAVTLHAIAGSLRAEREVDWEVSVSPTQPWQRRLLVKVRLFAQASVDGVLVGQVSARTYAGLERQMQRVERTQGLPRGFIYPGHKKVLR